MQKKNVRVGEVYEYRTSKYGNATEVRVNGPWQEPRGSRSRYTGRETPDYRPEGFPVERVTPGDGWCPKAADARHLTPIDEAKKKAADERAADLAKRQARETRCAAWGSSEPALGVLGRAHLDWEGESMTIRITDPAVALRLAELVKSNPGILRRGDDANQ